MLCFPSGSPHVLFAIRYPLSAIGSPLSALRYSARMASPLTSSQPDDGQIVICLYCNQPQEISRRAMTITCKHCHKSLRVEDVVIKQYEARRVIGTVGIITVEKRGNVVADKLQCGGMVVRGKVKGTIISRGPVIVGPEAEIKGDVTAPAMAVGAGAILEGNYRVGQGHSDCLVRFDRRG